jgi:hypothetical protein
MALASGLLKRPWRSWPLARPPDWLGVAGPARYPPQYRPAASGAKPLSKKHLLLSQLIDARVGANPISHAVLAPCQ